MNYLIFISAYKYVIKYIECIVLFKITICFSLIEIYIYQQKIETIMK